MLREAVVLLDVPFRPNVSLMAEVAARLGCGGGAVEWSRKASWL